MIINYLRCCTRFFAKLIGVNSPSFPFSAFAGSNLRHLYPFYSRVYSRRGRLLALIRILNLILSLINSHILWFISFILREHPCQLRLKLEAIFSHVIFVSFSRFLLCGPQFYNNFILTLHSIIRSFTRHLISCLFYLREIKKILKLIPLKLRFLLNWLLIWIVLSLSPRWILFMLLLIIFIAIRELLFQLLLVKVIQWKCFSIMFSNIINIFQWL